MSPLPQDDDAGETRAATIEVLRRAGIAPDAWVVCELSDRCRTGVGHAYVGTPVRAMALVEGAPTSSASPRRYFFETAATFASHPREAERLRHFASKDGRDELWYYNERERRCVREFLEDFPSVAMPLGWMLTTAPRLRPRLFSIASAASAAPDAIHSPSRRCDGKPTTAERDTGCAPTPSPGSRPVRVRASWRAGSVRTALRSPRRGTTRRSCSCAPDRAWRRCDRWCRTGSTARCTPGRGSRRRRVLRVQEGGG